MNKFRWLAASAMSLGAVPIAAATTGPFSPAALSQIDKTISSDAFEGRGPATRAETKTINYIADQFRAAGVQPGGDMVDGQRSWFQAVSTPPPEPPVTNRLLGSTWPLATAASTALIKSS